MATLAGFTPFPREFATRYRARRYWEDMSLGAAYAQIFARYRDRTALVFGEEHITYGQLSERIDRLALHLLDVGLQPLDVVVVQLPNVPELVYLYFALQRLGALPIMALPLHRYLEVSTFVTLAGARGYAVPTRLGDFEFAPLARQLLSENDQLRWIFVAGGAAEEGFLSLSELLRMESRLGPAALEGLPIDPTLPALFLLSGGTTGVPKLIPRTHNDYLYNARAAAAVNDIRPDDALLVSLPLEHNFPLACPGMSGFLLHGARVVLSTTQRAEDVFPLIERERVTHLEVVPALLIRWLDALAIGRYDLPTVRVINSGGQRLQPEVKRRAERLIPSARVQEVFGMAEGLLCYVRLDDDDEVRYETVGRPVSADDEIKLVDDNGREVPDGEVGELLTRGPYTIRGYFRAPEHNTQSFTADGFYRTGDLLRRHPSGNYVVAGRKKDLINRGGEKISAEEIENLIVSHPAVLNVACVPVPDPRLGERMCACVILNPGETLELTELTRFLVEKGIARFKLPEYLQVMDEFPLTRVGKISKKDLAEQVARLLPAGIER
jgi:2,3-dihydroxybenzoate-AMP ligase